MSGPNLAFGRFLLTPDNGMLIRDGEPIAVGQRGASLLEALLRHPGQVVTKAELMDAAWPGIAVEESNLSVQMAALRKLLGPAPNGGEWIATIPRVGYRFVGEVGEASADPTKRLSVTEPVIPSLAVLPFQNLSGDPEQDYFADGVVEDIITALSRFKSVRGDRAQLVLRLQGPRRRCAPGRERPRRPLRARRKRAAGRQPAQDLGATGRRRHRCSSLGAKSSTVRVEDVFDFQDRITESVATVVEPHIQMAEIERSRRERPRSLAAYDLYLRALAQDCLSASRE